MNTLKILSITSALMVTSVMLSMNHASCSQTLKKLVFESRPELQPTQKDIQEFLDYIRKKLCETPVDDKEVPYQREKQVALFHKELVSRLGEKAAF